MVIEQNWLWVDIIFDVFPEDGSQGSGGDGKFKI